MSSNGKDRTILRDLAKQLAEIAELPVQKRKAELWTRLNGLERVRPLIYVSPAPSIWEELLPEDTLQTQDPWSRRQEYALRQRLYHWEHLRDDAVFDAEWPCPIVIRDSGWGVQEKSVRPDHWFGARSFQTVIEKESDLEKIQPPRVSVDWRATEANYERLCGVFGDILNVRKQGVSHLNFAIMDAFIKFRGVERMFLDLIERPAWIHEAMERMTQGALGRIDQLQELNVLALNNGNSRSGSGGLAFTDELPQGDFDGAHVRPKDMWGHATTQIFSDVSPAMHEEFALRYERRFMERFGLCNYGCCEPLHRKTHILRGLPNLRKVSMSPWVDVEAGAAGLGADYVFSYKPNPAALAADEWNAQAVRAGLRDMFEKTKGCVVEVILKDLHTCGNEPRRVWEWTTIAMELAEEFA